MGRLRKLKLMPIILAGVLFVAGIIILAVSYSGFSEPALAILVGTLILGIGTTRLVYGFLTYKEELDARNNITLGVLDAIWGIMMLVLNANSFAFVTLFGLWCLIAAVLETIEILNNVVAKRPMLHLLADAIINLLFGVLMMIRGTFAGQFPVFVGIYLVLNALTTFMVTLLSIRGVYHPEVAVAEITGVTTEQPAVEEVKAEPAKEEAPAEVKEEPKAPAKKTTTKSTTAKKTSVAAKKTTTAKKTTSGTAKKSTTKKTTAKTEVKD